MGALTLTGAAATGQRVTVRVDGTPAGTVDAAAGAWRLDVVLAPGRHVVTAAYADGMTSAPLTVVVDRITPGAGLAPRLAAASDSGVRGDNVTTDSTPTVTGTAGPGATGVRVLLDGAVAGVAPVQADGTGRFTLPALRRGTHRVTVRTVDRAGNVGPASAALRIRLDVARPTVAAPRTRALTQPRVTAARVVNLVAWSGTDAGAGSGPVAFQL